MRHLVSQESSLTAGTGAISGSLDYMRHDCDWHCLCIHAHKRRVLQPSRGAYSTAIDTHGGNSGGETMASLFDTPNCTFYW